MFSPDRTSSPGGSDVAYGSLEEEDVVDRRLA